MSDSLIKVDGLSKKFCRSLKRSMWYGMQDLGRELVGLRHSSVDTLRPDEFWAVKDISFELKRGECLGLIGHNGAGKTTLLKMLNGLIRPDQGRVEMHGTIGALIALGAGFNPILTGRENIYVNASVLGMNKRHVDKKIDEIIDFAEIPDFIDAPVQTYSSGMNVRLGFAVAAILLEPDILFLDEVLAVGDVGFAMKCLNVIRGLSSKSAVVLVSHNMPQISWFCTRVMVLERGRMLIDSMDVAAGIDQYYSLLSHDEQVFETGVAQVIGLRLMEEGNLISEENPLLVHGREITARLNLKLATEATVLLLIRDESQTPVIAIPLLDQHDRMKLPCGELELDIPLGSLELNSGKYSFVVLVSDAASDQIVVRKQGICPFRMLAARNYVAKVVRPVTPTLSKMTE
jgi:lipopolysaccharide transport system ATP-binding protein